jgi:hypothetical protein
MDRVWSCTQVADADKKKNIKDFPQKLFGIKMVFFRII